MVVKEIGYCVFYYLIFLVNLVWYMRMSLVIFGELMGVGENLVEFCWKRLRGEKYCMNYGWFIKVYIEIILFLVSFNEEKKNFFDGNFFILFCNFWE